MSARETAPMHMSIQRSRAVMLLAVEVTVNTVFDVFTRTKYMVTNRVIRPACINSIKSQISSRSRLIAIFSHIHNLQI